MKLTMVSSKANVTAAADFVDQIHSAVFTQRPGKIMKLEARMLGDRLFIYGIETHDDPDPDSGERLKVPVAVEYPQDCIRMKRLAAEKGYDLTLHECEQIWQWHSNSVCASWLMLRSSDDDLWTEMCAWLDEIGGP